MKNPRLAGTKKILRAIRKARRTPLTDAPALLRNVAEIQKAFEESLTPEERTIVAEQSRKDDSGAPIVYSTSEKAAALDDFALLTAAESMEILAEQISTIAQKKREALYRKVLDVYYALEDAYEDPNNPDRATILEHLENLRRAHQSQYGRPIPERN